MDTCKNTTCVYSHMIFPNEENKYLEFYLKILHC